MSRSWTRFLSRPPAARVGLVIGRDRVCAVAPGEARGGAPLISEQMLPMPLFSGPPTAAQADALTAALRTMAAQFPQRCPTVQVALPDSVIRSTVFELDELPARASLRQTLVQWRFATLWQRAHDSLDCRAQALGLAQGKQLLLGQAADRAWLDLVRQALRAAQWPAHSLNAAAVYRFNHLLPTLPGGAGALVTLDPECWSLLQWDATRRLRRVATRLRGPLSADDDPKALAAEVWRLLQAEAPEAIARQPVQIVGDAGEAGALSETLAAWLPVAPVLRQVQPATALSSFRCPNGPAQLALTAALCP